MTYASTSDVSSRAGRALTAAENVQVAAWLTDTEALIRARIPDVDARISAGQLDTEIVVMVEANAVVRKLQNPSGLRSITTAVDDGSITQVRDRVLSDGALRISDEEWEHLLPAEHLEVASVRLGFEPGWGHHRGYRSHDSDLW